MEEVSQQGTHLLHRGTTLDVNMYSTDGSVDEKQQQHNPFRGMILDGKWPLSIQTGRDIKRLGEEEKMEKAVAVSHFKHRLCYLTKECFYVTPVNTFFPFMEMEEGWRLCTWQLQKWHSLIVYPPQSFTQAHSIKSSLQHLPLSPERAEYLQYRSRQTEDKYSRNVVCRNLLYSDSCSSSK